MQRLRRHRPLPAAAALLALALLWAQTLGLLHRVQHAPRATVVAAVQADDGKAAGLYAHDRQSESCKLYDQLALGDAAVPTADAAPLVVGDAPVPADASGRPAGAARHAYRARAPPLSIA